VKLARANPVRNRRSSAEIPTSLCEGTSGATILRDPNCLLRGIHFSVLISGMIRRGSEKKVRERTEAVGGSFTGNPCEAGQPAGFSWNACVNPLKILPPILWIRRL